MAGQPQQMNPQQAAPPPPRRPRKIPYRDGISRSPAYYDIYEMIRTPHAHRETRPPDPPPHASDPYYRPPTKQQKLEKKIQKKFEKNDYKLPGNRFETTGKVLKFIFLVLGLPLYLVLYSLPRALFVLLLPFIFNQLDRKLSAVAHRTKITLQSILQKGIAPVRKIRNKLRIGALEKKEAFHQSILAPLSLFFRRKIEALKKFAEGLCRLPKKGSASFQNGILSSKKWLSTSIQRIKRKGQQAKKTLKEFIIRPRIWFQSKVGQIKQSLQALKANLKKNYQKIKHTVLHPFETITKVLEKRGPISSK